MYNSLQRFSTKHVTKVGRRPTEAGTSAVTTGGGGGVLLCMVLLPANIRFSLMFCKPTAYTLTMLLKTTSDSTEFFRNVRYIMLISHTVPLLYIVLLQFLRTLTRTFQSHVWESVCVCVLDGGGGECICYHTKFIGLQCDRIACV